MNELSLLPHEFWPRVKTAPHRLLMLDYDGTLAPLRQNRMDARLPRRNFAALRTLSSRPATTVVVISGRGMGELAELTAGLELTLVGEHGWMTRERDGTEKPAPLPAAAARALDEAEAVARANGLGERLERKRTGLVLHLRGLAPEPAAAIDAQVRALWRGILAGPELRLDPIHGGLELRAAGRDKGTAVLEYLAQQPPQTLPVYVGDDFADEDAFRTVKARGFGIRVGSEDAATEAGGRLPGLDAVSAFLEEWLRVTGDLSQPAAR
jgi:trehalose-phosphatase